MSITIMKITKTITIIILIITITKMIVGMKIIIIIEVMMTYVSILFTIFISIILFIYFNETAKALDFAQKLNARERASMRRDILKEQKAAVSDMGNSVYGLKSEIEELNLLSQIGKFNSIEYLTNFVCFVCSDYLNKF